MSSSKLYGDIIPTVYINYKIYYLTLVDLICDSIIVIMMVISLSVVL